MKKSKLLKSLGFASLALLMGATGIFAFTTLGRSSGPESVATATQTTTETGGLINPKADDPVIYTTESGIEIKYGNAVPITSNSSLGSGNLKGFPYFETKNGSTTYTWVIIGRNPNVTTLSTAIESYLFSTWKTNNSSSDGWVYGKTFFDTTYETLTPAGNSIYSDTSSKGDINDNISIPINNLTSNNEIPSECILALANSATGTCSFYSGNNYTTAENQTFAGANNTLRAICANYYTNDTFGFGNYKSSLQSITLNQHGNYTNRWTHKELTMTKLIQLQILRLVLI